MECFNYLNNEDIRYKFKNVINVAGVPKKAKPDNSYEINPFSDMGAWHAYHLPSSEEPQYYGGFTGPLFIAQEYGIWLSKCISRIKIYDVIHEKEINLACCKESNFVHYPGKLVQSYNLDKLSLTLELIFATNRTALIKTTIKNNSEEKLILKPFWDGDIFKFNDISLEANNRGIKVKFNDTKLKWEAYTTAETEYEIRYSCEVDTIIKGNNYIASVKENISLKPEEEFIVSTANSYTFTKAEKLEEDKKIEDILKQPLKYMEDNDNRWKRYLLAALKGKSEQDDLVAVKAVQTLITNWRSPAGSIKRDGITPSMSYAWFNGMWAWDSWKQAVAVSHFAPELAMDNIRAMFDYQREDGMIIDAIFYNKNGDNWNERNSKPPLAAWAVWQLYEETNDKEFLEEMYPKLVKYHSWWYACRDNDKNGIAEYGASLDKDNNDDKSIVQAAAWESGMDNAVRFDLDYGVSVLHNLDKEGQVNGYSINQESVDLNAYLYFEKILLSRIAELIEKPEEAINYRKEAEYVKDFIQKYMFSEADGFFYDIDIKSKEPLTSRGKGTEGIIPLWAGAASEKQSEGVKNIILDKDKFNTTVPIPTASKDNPRYNASKYWRGPVWLDQAYFAIEGLDLYGYRAEASRLARQLIDNAEGVREIGKVFRENYNPESGAGLHCTNFSWSAGMIYLLYKKYL